MGISGCLFSSPATCINLSVTLLSMGSLNMVILFSNIIATSGRSETTLKGHLHRTVVLFKFTLHNEAIVPASGM